MSIYHDEVEIEDMEFDEETETYYFPCPCGDKFSITKVSFQFVHSCDARDILRNTDYF
jgi:CSL zinc finger